MDFENLIFTKLTVHSFSSIQMFNFVICYNIALRFFRGKFSFYLFLLLVRKNVMLSMTKRHT